MPTYRYRCADCGNEFEQRQKFTDDPLKTCPSCAGSIRRVIQPVGVVFKGSGWYVTDSRPAEKSGSNGSAPAEKSETGEKSDKSDKAATKTDAKETPAAGKPAETKKTADTKVAASA